MSVEARERLTAVLVADLKARQAVVDGFPPGTPPESAQFWLDPKFILDALLAHPDLLAEAIGFERETDLGTDDEGRYDPAATKDGWADRWAKDRVEREEQS